MLCAQETTNLEGDQLECVGSGNLHQRVQLLLDCGCETRQVDGSCVLQELLGWNVFRDDKVGDCRLGTGDPSGEAELRRVGTAADRANSLDTMKRLPNDARDESRCGSRRNTGSDHDRGESEDDTIDELSSSVLVHEEFGNELAHTIGSLGCCDGSVSDDFGERTAIDGKRGSEDESDEVSGGRSLLSGGIKHAPDRVNVDLLVRAVSHDSRETHSQTKIKVVFRTSTHYTVEAIDCIGNTVLGCVQCLDLLGVAQIGFSGNDILRSFGRFGLDDVDQDEVDVRSLRVLQ